MAAVCAGVLDPVSKLVLPEPEPLGGQDEGGLEDRGHRGETPHRHTALRHGVETHREPPRAVYISRITVIFLDGLVVRKSFPH